MAEDHLKINCREVRGTDQAVLIEVVQTRRIWVPKSLIKTRTQIAGERQMTIEIPEWFAESKELS